MITLSWGLSLHFLNLQQLALRTPSLGAVLVALTSKFLPLPAILTLTADLSCQAVPQPLSLPTTLTILIGLMNSFE